MYSGREEVSLARTAEERRAVREEEEGEGGEGEEERARRQRDSARREQPQWNGRSRTAPGERASETPLRARKVE